MSFLGKPFVVPRNPRQSRGLTAATRASPQCGAAADLVTVGQEHFVAAPTAETRVHRVDRAAPIAWTTHLHDPGTTRDRVVASGKARDGAEDEFQNGNDQPSAEQHGRDGHDGDEEEDGEYGFHEHS